MSLIETLSADQTLAMKQGDKDRLSILRMVNSAVKNAQIEAGATLSDVQAQEVIARQVKQLKDALVDFTTGGREDLIAKTQQEIAILSGYLPAQMSADDIRAKAKELLAGQTDLSAGQAMGMVMKELKGQADGTLVREIVSEMVK